MTRGCPNPRRRKFRRRCGGRGDPRRPRIQRRPKRQQHLAFAQMLFLDDELPSFIQLDAIGQSDGAFEAEVGVDEFVGGGEKNAGGGEDGASGALQRSIGEDLENGAIGSQQCAVGANGHVATLLSGQRWRFRGFVSVFVDGNIFVPLQMFELLLLEGGDGVNDGWDLIDEILSKEVGVDWLFDGNARCRFNFNLRSWLDVFIKVIVDVNVIVGVDVVADRAVARGTTCTISVSRGVSDETAFSCHSILLVPGLELLSSPGESSSFNCQISEISHQTPELLVPGLEL